MRALAAVVLCTATAAADLGERPAMAWRNWNFFQGNITQETMQAQMKAMASRERPVWGLSGLHSLADVGYNRAGLDDNWQMCHAGFQGSFHDEQGNPIVNKTRFPDLKAMVDFGHSLNLSVGWYIK